MTPHPTIKDILQQAPRPQAGSDATGRIRERMLSEFRTVTKSAADRYNTTERHSFSSLLVTKHYMIPILIAAILLLGTTGTAIAADQALPGDPLYGIDRALERSWLGLSLSDTSRADRLLHMAEEREQEIERLRVQNRFDDVTQAQEHEQQALQNAQQVINRLQAEHTDNGNSSEALTNVAQRFGEISSRFQEREQEHVQSGQSDSDDDDADEMNENSDSDESPSDDDVDETEVNGSDNAAGNVNREQEQDHNRNQNLNQNVNHEPEQSQEQEQEHLQNQNQNQNTNRATNTDQSHSDDPDDEADD